MPVNVDDSRLDPPGLRYRKLEKALRSGGIAVRREEKSMVLLAESTALYK